MFDYSRNMEHKAATAALAALGQDTRLSVFRLLVRAGRAGRLAGDIAEALSLPGATLSFHLKALTAAGLVHGDLSEFNVLLGPDGPVIIDLPQAVDAAANNHAFSMLERDVRNMAEYFGQFAPELKYTKYAKEMWALYEAGKLQPDTPLTGEFAEPEDAADIDAVMREIKAALAEEAKKQALRNAEDEPKDAEPTPPWMR